MHSIPDCFATAVAWPLLIPDAQQNITGLLKDLISFNFALIPGKGIFLEPLICPDLYSSLLLTSTMIAPSAIHSLILSFLEFKKEKKPIILIFSKSLGFTTLPE